MLVISPLFRQFQRQALSFCVSAQNLADIVPHDLHGRHQALELRDAILHAIQRVDAVAGEHDEYGQRYIVDFSMKRQGNEAIVRTAWIIRAHETFPRLTSCYVL